MLIDKIKIRQNWGEKYTFEKDAQKGINITSFVVHGWDEEWAAKEVEKRLTDMKRGNSTNTSTSVTGDKYITFSGQGVMEEGQRIELWRNSKEEALHSLKNSVWCYYSTKVNFLQSTIYWRKKPELLVNNGKFAVVAQLVIVKDKS